MACTYGGEEERWVGESIDAPTILYQKESFFNKIRRERDDQSLKELKAVNLGQWSHISMAETYICQDGKTWYGLEDLEPNPQTIHSDHDQASGFTQELTGVDSNGYQVVGQREQGSQRKGRHEQYHETKLYDLK